ncbi:gamma-interferon-responsive lysosomal thiol protein isoform X1 [Arachis duranensis]|uniref:Gamma-interferon-responsive lysosomal thiol protein isoform X1 n=1 Tax=Arachis duranensis TaxID=130453 RepID=A0A6P4CFE2_ARADU|nr:gamma-interferon-responsive lysosomal thiol protein isoform X1 [Arachis duranensis]
MMKMPSFLHYSLPPPRSFFYFCLLLLLPLLLLLLLFVAPSSSSSSQDNNNNKVTLSLYYESLCPFCGDFIVNHLVKLFQTDLINIVNLRLVPWGNAWLAPDGTFLCQHGNDECFLNTIEACAVTVYPNVAQHFRFIHCIENLTLEGRQNQWVNCFQMTGLPKLPLDCYTNGNGKNIEQKFAQETTQLNPPHRFVPWVVVNNQALQEDYPNFVNYICKAYKGKSKPDGCRSLSTRTYDMMKDGNNSFQKPVCYVGHVKNLTLP